MIVSFNPNIFDSEDPMILNNLSKLFDEELLGNHRFNIFNVIDKLSDINFQHTYFSQYQVKELNQIIQRIIQQNSYITEVHKKYLSHITVGIGDGEIYPDIALKLLSIESRVILENATNDWKFIAGIAEKYKNHHST